MVDLDGPVRPKSHHVDPLHDDDPRLAQVVEALTRGRRVFIQSTEPIDGLAQSTWHALPRSVRRRATVATWAFDNANIRSRRSAQTRRSDA